MRISGLSPVNLNPTNRYPAQNMPEQADRRESDTAVQKPTEIADAEVLRQIQWLKNRDREVRTHEQAHLSAAGGIAVSGASFSYTVGPDGQRYAVGGEVGIDTSAVAGDPAATLRKAETIRRAALAPAQPSAQDYSVASRATAMASKATIELMRAQQNAPRSGSLLDVSA